MLILPMILLTLLQARLISRNLTSAEMAIIKKARHLPAGVINPFDLGFRGNLKCLLFPCDGVNWPVNHRADENALNIAIRDLEKQENTFFNNWYKSLGSFDGDWRSAKVYGLRALFLAYKYRAKLIRIKEGDLVQTTLPGKLFCEGKLWRDGATIDCYFPTKAIFGMDVKFA